MKELLKIIKIVIRLRWISAKDEWSDKNVFHLAVSSLLLALLIFISRSVAKAFWVFFTLEDFIQSHSTKDFIHLFCFSIFIFICFFYMKTGRGKINSGIYRFLHYQPISVKKIYFAFSFFELISGWLLVIIPFFVYLGFIFDMINVSWIIFIFFSLFFLITSIFFIQFILLLFENIFSSLGKIRSISWYVFFLGIIGISILTVWIRKNSETALKTIVDIFSSIKFSRLSVFFPSGIYAETLMLFLESNHLEIYLLWFGYWSLYLFFISWLGCFLLIRSLRNKQIKKVSIKSDNFFKKMENLNHIKLKNVIFFNELAYLLRTHRVVFITIYLWLVFLFVSIVPKDNIVGTYFLFIFSFIITQSTFSNNIFGTMKGEIVKSFILPVKESEILFHKNMAMGILWIIILLPGFISFSYFRWQEIRFYYLLLAIIFYIFSFFFYITIGNVLSILFPRKSSVDNIQMPLSIESYFVVFFTTPIPFAIFVVLYLIFDYFFKQPIFLFVLVFLLAVISIILYFKLLPIMGKLMKNRREELINTLFSKRWI